MATSRETPNVSPSGTTPRAQAGLVAGAVSHGCAASSAIAAGSAARGPRGASRARRRRFEDNDPDGVPGVVYTADTGRLPPVWGSAAEALLVGCGGHGASLAAHPGALRFSHTRPGTAPTRHLPSLPRPPSPPPGSAHAGFRAAVPLWPTLTLTRSPARRTHAAGGEKHRRNGAPARHRHPLCPWRGGSPTSRGPWGLWDRVALDLWSCWILGIP